MVSIFLKDMPLTQYIAWDFKQSGQVKGLPAHGRGSLRLFLTQTYSMILLFNVSFDLKQKSKDIFLVCFTQSE